MTRAINREQATTTQPKGSTSYQNFVNSIRSPATKTVYINSLKRYMNFVKLTEVDSLLEIDSHKVIESQLIDYIMSLRQDGVSYSTIKYLIAPVFTFYQLNDVLLNKKKVSRYLGEFKRVMKDKAYTTEQIQRALQNADQRMRMIILLLSSTGCRIGADCLVLLEHEKYQRKRMVRLEQGFPYTSLM